MPEAAVKYEERDYIQPDEVLTIELARGCKFQCKFCSFTVLGVKDDYSRCAESLDAELRENYEKWGVTMYTVSDETINDRPEKLKKIAEISRNLPFELNLMGFMRGDLLVANPDTWQDIWDMGLWSHFYGIETLNDQAGKYVGKGMKSERIKEGLVAAREWFQHPSRGLYKSTIAFILGFFLDWIEITLIILPFLAPVMVDLGVDLVWFIVMFAVVLQTSFITPPVGFALFYMKGVAPQGISITNIYKGIIPFVILQVIAVAIVFNFPEIVTWLPKVAYGP